MAKMDVLARIRKTGEERVYPEAVFENIADDTENPLEFIRYVEIPQDTTSQPQPQQSQPSSDPHSQLLVDALLKERQEKQALQDKIKELESAATDESVKKKVGRPTKVEA